MELHQRTYVTSIRSLKGKMSKNTVIFENTFTAHIYVGQRVSYSDTILPLELAENYLHQYVDKVGCCVTITPTKFIYSSNRLSAPIAGEEPGFIVSLINYPIYPEILSSTRDKAYAIATALKEIYHQEKVSIVYPDITQTIK